MTRAGRVVQVQVVLTAMLVYILMAVDLPLWGIKAIDKDKERFCLAGTKRGTRGTLSDCLAQDLSA